MLFKAPDMPSKLPLPVGYLDPYLIHGSSLPLRRHIPKRSVVFAWLTGINTYHAMYVETYA